MVAGGEGMGGAAGREWPGLCKPSDGSRVCGALAGGWTWLGRAQTDHEKGTIWHRFQAEGKQLYLPVGITERQPWPQWEGPSPRTGTEPLVPESRPSPALENLAGAGPVHTWVQVQTAALNPT